MMIMVMIMIMINDLVNIYTNNKDDTDDDNNYYDNINNKNKEFVWCSSQILLQSALQPQVHQCYMNLLQYHLPISI